MTVFCGVNQEVLATPRRLDGLIAGKGGLTGQAKQKIAASAFCRESVGDGK